VGVRVAVRCDYFFNVYHYLFAWVGLRRDRVFFVLYWVSESQFVVRFWLVWVSITLAKWHGHNRGWCSVNSNAKQYE